MKVLAAKRALRGPGLLSLGPLFLLGNRQSGQTLQKAPGFLMMAELGQAGDTESVPLHEPVKLEPPPPLAPPVTYLPQGCPVLGLVPSGVPAWSPLFIPQACWCPALTSSWL